ncbi:protein phosphatase methylesterase 1 [Macrosteles quadrilineatus]|uniref:protein phosphatase methylesterase 1 n=1 Tax=Macrosteles quadrilineatus TaxID=74068 RepID=UPI0023E2EB6A|nr:protein phosphatase methylesterase 1 [Macrosteles quadrilineatus]
MSSLQKAMLTSKFPPRATGQRGRRSSFGRHKSRDNEDYTPVEWNKYFQERRDVIVGTDSFRIYTIGEEGPVVVLLHGGGFSALTWAVLSKILYEMADLRILALDLRGHGDTITSNDSDLSIDTLVGDVINVINTVYNEDTPPLVLMGHSMGGAVAVNVASSEKCPGSIVGVAVIDVVEGTALSALASMQSFLRGRPHSFNSIEDAIKWSLQNGQLRNVESAKVSMAGQLKNVGSGRTATAELDNYNTLGGGNGGGSCDEEVALEDDAIREDEEATFKLPGIGRGQYTWRIDLKATEQYWSGWFQGLSQKFLTARATRLLLLASLDRLDTDLTIGQMQGKFEMHTFDSAHNRCGHAVHEDLPVDVANVVAAFLIRNQFTTAKESEHRLNHTMPSC